MTKQQSQIKYFLYARKSTDTEDRQITSIDDQIQEAKRLALARGVKIIRVFEEAQSAKKPGRPIFNEMMKLVIKGEANGILCWKLNRLARNPIDGGQIQWMLQSGVLESILTPSRDYNKVDDIMIMNFEFGMANQFVLDLSRDVKRGMIAKAARGWLPNKAPLGYKNSSECEGEKSIIVPDKNFVLVRKLFDLVLDEKATLEKLSDKALELGMKTGSSLFVVGSQSSNYWKFKI